MRGGRTLGRYLLQTVATAWAIVSVLFLLSRTVADQEAYLLNSLETDARLGAAEQRQLVQQLRHRAGLDAPIFYLTLDSQAGWQWHGVQNQYHRWAAALVRGDWGLSHRNDTPVRTLLLDALRYTLPLTTLAALASVGIALALALGITRFPRWQRGTLAVAYGLQALPLFLIATLLLLLLANPDALAWFPAFGLAPDQDDAPLWEQPAQALYYLALPAISLILVTAPALLIQLHGAIGKELQRPYVATARAKGAGHSRVLWHHVLRNALLPSIAQLADLLPGLVAGSVVVEVLFALPGMGRLLAEAAATHDYPVLSGGVTLVVVARLLAQAGADGLYYLVDPRIRLGT